MDYIRKNVEAVLENIRRAAEKSGRKAEDITLVGVTKTIDTDKIRALLDTGVVNLGENKVQELCDKYPVLGERPAWHLIGHLQTNKVKYIIDKVALIHSVDSEKLAVEIDRRARAAGRVMPVLIEVNMAEEDTKYGVSASNAHRLAQIIAQMESVRLKGLMTVAPYVENPEENREILRKMKYLFIDINSKFGNNSSMEFLSMGMTNDYEIAIEEGANIVRVGTGIFGVRDYTRCVE